MSIRAAFSKASSRARDRYRFSSGLAVGMSVVLVAVGVQSLLAPPEVTEDDTLVILSGRDDSAGGQRQFLINKWNQENPNNQARIEELSGSADQQRNEMVKRAQDADSDIDIYNLDVTWTAEFAENDYIRPLPEVDTDDLLPGPLDTCRYEKKLDGIPFSGEDLYALPFNTDAGLLYYRVDPDSSDDPAPLRFDDWSTMTGEINRIFEKGNRNPALYGYTAQLDNYEGLTVNILETIYHLGGNIEVDKNGDLQFNFRDVERAVDRLRPRTGDHVILPESLDYDEQRSTDAMRDGKVLFMRNWPLAYRRLNTETDADTEPTDRSFAVTQLFRGSILGGQNLAISRHSAKPEKAIELIEFLTNPESQKLLFEQGGFAPTRQSVYDKASTPADPFDNQILSNAVNIAVSRPQGPCYWHFSEIFHNTVTTALRTGKSIPDGEKFIKRLNSALKCEPG